MRYLVRHELDFDAPINLRRLRPIMKIYAGIVTKWRDTEYYKSNLNKRMEAAYAERVKRDEMLKEALLVLIYRELDNNASLAKKGEKCCEVVVCVQSRFIHSLDRILQHKDFLPYVIKKVPEEPDARLAFPEMPILLRVRKRNLKEANAIEETMAI